MAKIKVYRKDTGAIVRVPEHWMEHPVLGAPFRKTPSQKTRDLIREAEAAAEPEVAAAEAVHHTSTERAGTAATPNKSNRASASAGDAHQEA